MPVTYSLTAGAALLGVSVSTLSRHLPGERVAKGRPANLALDELLAVAPAVGVDSEALRRRVAAAQDIDPNLPEAIRVWVQRAREEGVRFPIEEYNARIPLDLLDRLPDAGDPAARPRKPRPGPFAEIPYADLKTLLTGDE